MAGISLGLIRVEDKFTSAEFEIVTGGHGFIRAITRFGELKAIGQLTKLFSQDDFLSVLSFTGETKTETRHYQRWDTTVVSSDAPIFVMGNGVYAVISYRVTSCTPTLRSGKTQMTGEILLHTIWGEETRTRSFDFHPNMQGIAVVNGYAQEAITNTYGKVVMA